MNSKQKKTFQKIFDIPTRSDIKWNEIVSMMGAMGAEIEEDRSGSRVAIIIKDIKLIIHKPHPNKEMAKWAIEKIRDYLIKVGG